MRLGNKHIKVENPGEKIFMGLLVTILVVGIVGLIVVAIGATIVSFGFWVIPILIALPFLLVLFYVVGDRVL